MPFRFLVTDVYSLAVRPDRLALRGLTLDGEDPRPGLTLTGPGGLRARVTEVEATELPDDGESGWFIELADAVPSELHEWLEALGVGEDLIVELHAAGGRGSRRPPAA
jgi:hypothetical protein